MTDQGERPARKKRVEVLGGRGLVIDGEHVVSILLRTDRAKWGWFGPENADMLTRRIADLLNEHGIGGSLFDLRTNDEAVQ